MSTENLPEWLQDWLQAEVAAGRANELDSVVLNGDMLLRAQAWLEDQIYDGLNIAPADRIDGRQFMAALGAMVDAEDGENRPPSVDGGDAGDPET